MRIDEKVQRIIDMWNNGLKRSAYKYYKKSEFDSLGLLSESRLCMPEHRLVNMFCDFLAYAEGSDVPVDEIDNDNFNKPASSTKTPTMIVSDNEVKTVQKFIGGRWMDLFSVTDEYELKIGERFKPDEC